MWTIGGTACSCCVALLSFFGQKNTIPLQLEGEICAMSQVVSSLEAVGRYLETAGSFPGFAQAKESHIAFLTSQFGRHTWSVTEGSEALELLQRQVVWTDAERSALAMAVQNGLAARCAAISRQAMQDYTNVILYLPARIWEQLMNSDLTFQAKANLVGTFATSLGLRNPSESTSQMVTSLLLACPGGRDLELKRSLAPQQLYELFLLVKKELRSTVAAAPPSDGLPHVDKLPTNPEQMDARWLQHALGQEPVGRCPLTLSQVAARAVTIPMRNTNRHLHESSSSHRRQQSQKLRSLVSSSPALLSLLNGLQDVDEEELEIPGFRLCGRAAPPQRIEKTTVALEAPPQHAGSSAEHASVPKVPPATPASKALDPVLPSQALVPVQTSPVATCSAVSAAALLQEQWREAKECEKRDAAPQQEMSEQETAVAPKNKTQSKKPKTAAKKQSKPQVNKTSHGTKSSAAKTKSSSAKTKTKDRRSRADRLKEDFQVRRAAGIPLKLLRNQEAGCARCRNRPWCTRSCWALKGFTI